MATDAPSAASPRPGTAGAPGAWPALPLAEWQASYATVHLWTQLLGKTRLALSPPQNHWWHTALYLTARGLGTALMPFPRERHVAAPGAADGGIELELDFITHRLVARVTDGREAALPLTGRPLAEFHRDYRLLLRELGLELRLWPMPVELEGAVRFDSDTAARAYDAAAVQRCWRIMVQVGNVLQRFRGEFTGKCSPVHFWWGAFDLACTRFSGRPAPAHPGGVPNLADHVARSAYSHECMSAGWWPGTPGGPVAEPALYAYAYPEPPGFSTASVGPAGAAYHPMLREWILPYDAVRQAADPEAACREFFDDSYRAAAELGSWEIA